MLDNVHRHLMAIEGSFLDSERLLRRYDELQLKELGYLDPDNRRELLNLTEKIVFECNGLQYRAGCLRHAIKQEVILKYHLKFAVLWVMVEIFFSETSG